MVMTSELAHVYHWVDDYRPYADYDNTQTQEADALLADLQSTTSHIEQYQQRAQEAASREGTPPPLPPHPSESDMYDLGQNLYEPQQIKSPAPPQQAQMHSTTVVTKVNNHMQPSNPQRSSLSNNLSELDTLLQDLSSAQFMAEVDRRNSGTTAANGYGDEEVITPQSRAPPPRGNDVDNLLDQLDRQQSFHSEDLNHYEQVNVQQQRPSYQSPPSKPPVPLPGMTAAHHPPPPHGAVAAHHHGLPPPPGASTATRELDDLMASLSEFKMGAPGHTGDPPYAQPHKIPRPDLPPPPQHSPGVHSNHSAGSGGAGGYGAGMQNGGGQFMGQNGEVREEHIVQSARATQHNTHTDSGGNLEAMLGNLSTDMSKQGVMTVPKGHCAACSNPIVGQKTSSGMLQTDVITALGRIWHPEHFNCTHCKVELGTQNFFERDGLPFCERDYHMLFSPRCASCNGPILDKCITALDKSWHPEHFVCAHCKRPFGEDGFHEREGLAYCREDYFDMFAPKCGGCDRPIMENYISALNKQWHPECFVCYECRTSFGSSSFFDHDGFPYCETHYHAKRGSLCAGCQKPISGRCITAMYKKFHPEHFVCAFCLKQLNKGTFKEQNDKPYCHPCFVKLFG